MLTFKTAAVHTESGSRPEYETTVADRQAVEQILSGLGFVVDLAFEERECLATLVVVPEVGDATFLEVETMVPTEDHVPTAIGAIKRLLAEFGIGARELNRALYQDMVLRHRESG